MDNHIKIYTEHKERGGLTIDIYDETLESNEPIVSLELTMPAYETALQKHNEEGLLQITPHMQKLLDEE